MTEIGETVSFNLGDNQCFGCSQERADGLRLAFIRTGERTVECRYSVPHVYRGMGGVAHGGMQAVLLDEACGAAAYLFWPPETYAVTAELTLTYRRPVSVESPILVRGELTSEDERDFHVTGSIVDLQGNDLTTANARFRKLRQVPGREE